MGPLIQILIGHRGAGKTSFLKGVQTWTRTREMPFVCLDLDREMEKATGKTIAYLFAAGEKQFRDLEYKTLLHLLQSTKTPGLIAVGAGFEGPLPEGVHAVWIQRSSDSAGRSFLNRPRLNSEVAPHAEYMERFPMRGDRFREWSHEQLVLPEGYETGLEEFVLSNALKIPYALTVLPENFLDGENFFKKRKGWNIQHWEIRDDLLNAEQIERARAALPIDHILYSRRLPEASWPTDVKVDWALELGEPARRPYSISLHEREEDFASTLERISAYQDSASILKLAVEVKDFTELKGGHQWWLKDPERRSFLPRSPTGRWRWYRSLFGPRMPLHFFREGEASALDQPLLWQTQMQTPLTKNFAAVLGSPVEHSRTPIEHLAFFRERSLPVVAVDIPEEDFSFAFQYLRELGLTHAAVTAPLKRLAWALADRSTPVARQMQAGNSIYIDENGKVTVHNTDVLALRQLRKDLPEAKNVWLWGGGGIKTSVRSVWPEIAEISARKGTSRTDSPDLLIWAVGRQRRFQWPPPDLRPRLILDLNYADDSPGLEWAAQKNLPYQSGLIMFKLQAGFQRTFWEACEQGEMF